MSEIIERQIKKDILGPGMDWPTGRLGDSQGSMALRGPAGGNLKCSTIWVFLRTQLFEILPDRHGNQHS